VPTKFISIIIIVIIVNSWLLNQLSGSAPVTSVYSWFDLFKSRENAVLHRSDQPIFCNIHLLPSPPLSVTLSHVCTSVCPPTARRISLGGEGNALYSVLSSYFDFSNSKYVTCKNLHVNFYIQNICHELVYVANVNSQHVSMRRLQAYSRVMRPATLTYSVYSLSTTLVYFVFGDKVFLFHSVFV